MKNVLKTLFILAMTLICVFAFIGCNNDDAPDNNDPEPSGPSTQQPSDDKTDDKPSTTDTPTGTLPTASQVVSAIKAQTESEAQNYDFKLQLSGNITVGGITTPNANALYDCNYRYNGANKTTLFKRVTSGILLYDSTEYIQSTDDSNVTVKMDDKNKVKKVVVSPKEELSLVNAPFVGLVSSLEAKDITDIASSANGYTAKLKLSSDNAALKLICNSLGKMDLSLSLKGVEFTNPVNGLGFEFSMTNGALTGYTLTANVSVPVASASVALDLRYEQTDSASAITFPSYDTLIVDKTEIAKEMNGISAKLAALKTDPAYSLDVSAINEMDPSWRVLAIEDSYKARLYKNTTADKTVAFNHSYVYKSHHEEDGAESYKYTIGNLEDGTVHRVSRKELINKSEALTNVTADTQFDYLTAPFAINATDVDCIKAEKSTTTTTYSVYLGDKAVKQLSDKIVAMINSNTAEGVLKLDNFIGSEYTIKDASFTIVVTSDKIVSMELETEMRYNPIGGEYTEYNVALENELTLEVNKKLDDAKKYKPAKKATGIGDSLDYIL